MSKSIAQRCATFRQSESSPWPTRQPSEVCQEPSLRTKVMIPDNTPLIRQLIPKKLAWFVLRLGILIIGRKKKRPPPGRPFLLPERKAHSMHACVARRPALREAARLHTRVCDSCAGANQSVTTVNPSSAVANESMPAAAHLTSLQSSTPLPSPNASPAAVSASHTTATHVPRFVSLAAALRGHPSATRSKQITGLQGGKKNPEESSSRLDSRFSSR